MKLLRKRTLGMFGIGFLAGSAAGPGPWQKAQETMDQMKGKVSGGGTNGGGAMNGGGSMNGGSQSSSSTDGTTSQKGGQGSPQLTEM